jgi:hypothetical protein
MKKIITAIIFFLTFYQLSNAQSFSWVSQLALDDYNIANSIKVDAAGNSYISGHYYITGGPGPQTGTSGAFIAKYNSAGALLWRDTIKGSDEAGGRIDLDASGNVYFSTFITGTHMVGGTSVTSTGMRDILIVKYNSAGVKQWIKTAGSTSNDAAQGIAVDAAGNVYVTGYFGGTASFDGTMKTAVGYSDIFVAKYTSAGTLAWVQTASGDGDTISGVGFDQTLDLALDNLGNPVVSGYFVGDAAFGSTTLTSTGNSSGFIAKLDALGNWTWVKQMQVTPQGLDFDNAGNGYMIGSFINSVNIGTNSFTSSGSTDIYLAKFDSNGNITWAKQAGSADEDRGYDVALDNLGNPYLAASFFGNIGIGDTNLVIAGEENSLVAKYDASGNFLWAKQIKAHTGAWEFVTAHAIDVSTAGDSYVAGSFYSAAIFDAFSLTATNASDAFVAKLLTGFSAGMEEETNQVAYSVLAEGNMITLEYNSNKMASAMIQIVNVSGQCIHSENNVQLNGSGRKEIIVSDLAKGIYFINIIIKDKQQTSKFIIN